MLDHLFHGASELPCTTAAANDLLLDTNGDMVVGLADVMYTLLHLFASGPEPVLGSGCASIAGCPSACE